LEETAGLFELNEAKLKKQANMTLKDYLFALTTQLSLSAPNVLCLTQLNPYSLG